MVLVPATRAAAVVDFGDLVGEAGTRPAQHGVDVPPGVNRGFSVVTTNRVTIAWSLMREVDVLACAVGRQQVQSGHPGADLDGRQRRDGPTTVRPWWW